MRGFRNIFILLFLSSFAWMNESYALERNNTNHRVRSFHCINNHYVFSTWFCDGINDCGDGSDEAYGCDAVKCGAGNFTCQEDSKCMDISVRCNKKTDCTDGSDEQYCFHEPPMENCTIENGKFLCNDKLRCVDLSRVCDQELHCFDGSDEGGKCDEYDHEQCNHCHHACFRTPIGPHCFYDPESQKYDDVHREIQSCPTAKNYCDQKCVSYHDVSQCSCEENFVPSYTLFQSFYCEEKEKNRNWLLFTTTGAIRGIQGYNNLTSKLIREINDPVWAIAAGNESVYLGRTYEKNKVIERVSLKSSDFGKSIIIVSEGIKEINAMDVDWRTGNVYFIDNGNHRIAACRSDGILCIEVVSLTDIGTSIALAPREGTMFWSMRSDEYGFVIKKSDMNGQSQYDFVYEGLGDIYSIACDEASERLFWLDSTRRKIEVIRFNGEGKKIFKSDMRMEYNSITINARYLYWLVNNTGSSANPTSRNSIYFSSTTRLLAKIAFNNSDPVLKIYGYSYSEKSTKMRHPCAWGCGNGICLTHSRYFNKTGADCICTNSSEHQTDNWCRKTADNFLGYNYDEYYPEYHPEEPPHYPVRIVLVCVSLLIIVSGVSFYLYRQDYFQRISLFRHIRF